MIIIGGATATGKSELAILCAKELNAEIISMDSMQIYKYMNIGTAKNTDAQCGIPHYMIDIREPWEEYSVSEYKKEALVVADNLKAQGKRVIFVGGTGLYASALLYPFNFGGVQKDSELRASLQEELDKFGKDYLYDKLCGIDKTAAEKMHPNNTRRVIRALEIAISGERKEANREQDARFSVYALSAKRDILYGRINARVEKMREQGLEEEVKGLLAMGVDFSCQSMQAIGYKEWKDSSLSKAEIFEKIKQNTRNYAKRQITWFKQYKQCDGLDASEGMQALRDRICADYYKKQAKI
jgi:tRNA dimethylallyltransferase